MKELLAGVLHVSAWESDGWVLNSYLYEGDKWSLLIDPPGFTDELGKELEPWNVEYVLCTSRATFDDALHWRQELGSKIVLHIWDAEEHGNRRGREVDRPYLHDFWMKGDVRIVHAPGASPGSSVAIATRQRLLFAGDLLSADAGRMVRAPWFDEEMARMSLEKLLEQAWGFDRVLPRRSRGPALASADAVATVLDKIRD